MSKQFKIYLLVFGVLLLTVLILIMSNQDSTLRLKTSGFSIDDVNRINEVVLKRGESELVLTKKEEGWLINEEHQADNQLMINFLRALENLRVKSPVSLGEQERILNMVFSDGIVVMVKKRWSTKTFRVWYVEGRPTYMVLGNSKSPFIMEVPGLLYEVGEFFRPEETFWRENVIFSLNADQIQSVRVEYPSGLGSGFEIISHEENGFELHSLSAGIRMENFSESLVFQYLTYFSFVPYNQLLTSVMEDKLDSLLKEVPFSEIKVTGRNNQSSVLELYLIETEGDKGEYNPDKLYGIINGRKDLVLVTFVSVDLLLRELDYFFSKEGLSIEKDQ